MSAPELVTTAELARIVRVGADTIARWRKSRLIPFIRINRTTVRYDVGEVFDALRQRQQLASGTSLCRKEGTANV
jgi:hypothetical protein